MLYALTTLPNYKEIKYGVNAELENSASIYFGLTFKLCCEIKYVVYC